MHGPHESLPGYHPDQLLVDGCDECEERGRHPNVAIAHLDEDRFERAWIRAAALERDLLGDEDHVSHAEIGLLRVLWAVQCRLEPRGVPIGQCPGSAGPGATWAAPEAIRAAEKAGPPPESDRDGLKGFVSTEPVTGRTPPDVPPPSPRCFTCGHMAGHYPDCPAKPVWSPTLAPDGTEIGGQWVPNPGYPLRRR
jgi:hypothetical protein